MESMTVIRAALAQTEILFGISGIFALILLQELRKMFKTVLNGDCFIRENVQSLKRMGICSFCIAAVTALRLFLYLTPAVLITILVFVIAGLFFSGAVPGL